MWVIALFAALTSAQAALSSGQQNAPVFTATTGGLDKGLDEAAAKGWTVVDMKRDWKRVFAFEGAGAGR